MPPFGPWVGGAGRLLAPPAPAAQWILTMGVTLVAGWTIGGLARSRLETEQDLTDEQIRVMLGRIATNTRRLSACSTTSWSLDRLDAGRLELEHRPRDLALLVHEVLEADWIRDDLDAATRTTVHAPGPVVAEVDATRTRRDQEAHLRGLRAKPRGTPAGRERTRPRDRTTVRASPRGSDHGPRPGGGSASFVLTLPLHAHRNVTPTRQKVMSRDPGAAVGPLVPHSSYHGHHRD